MLVIQPTKTQEQIPQAQKMPEVTLWGIYRYQQADLQQQHRHRTWARVAEWAHTQIYPAAMHMASLFFSI